MGKTKNKEPIYDERVKATLKGLEEGKTRAELAKSFGLSSWKSLDVSLRRKISSGVAKITLIFQLTTKWMIF